MNIAQVEAALVEHIDSELQSKGGTTVVQLLHEMELARAALLGIDVSLPASGLAHSIYNLLEDERFMNVRLGLLETVKLGLWNGNVLPDIVRSMVSEAHRG